MAADSFPAAMQHVFVHEGGYVDHPRDPGGSTNMGITIATLRDWRDKPVTKDDVRALTRAEAMAIYRSLYWDTVRGDELPAGVDYAVFDFAINSGPGRAARYLQRVVKVEQDGDIGPITVAATARMDPATVINALCDARLAFLKDLSGWDTFGRGWERRVTEVREGALALAQSPTKPADAPEPPPAPSPALPLEARLSALESGYAGILSKLPPADLAERLDAMEQRLARQPHSSTTGAADQATGPFVKPSTP